MICGRQQLNILCAPPPQRREGSVARAISLLVSGEATLCDCDIRYPVALCPSWLHGFARLFNAHFRCTISRIVDSHTWLGSSLYKSRKSEELLVGHHRKGSGRSGRTPLQLRGKHAPITTCSFPTTANSATSEVGGFDGAKGAAHRPAARAGASPLTVEPSKCETRRVWLRQDRVF